MGYGTRRRGQNLKTSRRLFLGSGAALVLTACQSRPAVVPRLSAELRGLRPTNVSIRHQKMRVDFDLLNRSTVALSLARLLYKVTIDDELWVAGDLGGFIDIPANSRKLIRDVHTLKLEHWGRLVAARAQNSPVHLTGFFTLANSPGRWNLTDTVKARQIDLSSTNDAEAGL